LERLVSEEMIFYLNMWSRTYTLTVKDEAEACMRAQRESDTRRVYTSLYSMEEGKSRLVGSFKPQESKVTDDFKEFREILPGKF
jgi:hypothetical protein